MKISSLVLVLSTTAPSNVPIEVPLSQLAYQPDVWADRVVRFCGLTNPGSNMVYSHSGKNESSGVVVRADVPRKVQGRKVCIVGRLVRRDGLTQKEAAERNLPFRNYTDLGYNPDYEVANVRP